MPEPVQAQRTSAPPVPAAAPRRSSVGGGQPLAPAVAGPISSSFGVDVSGVRVHTGPEAAEASGAYGARAFAYGSDVFLGSGQRPTDLPLMAHEVAHVVQQDSAPRVQLWGGGPDRYEREAESASAAAVQRRPFSIRERVQTGMQRFGIDDVLDKFADWANAIPGFRMFTIVIGVNPVNMSRVERSAANIMRAIVEFLPGGNLITRALDAYGVFDRVGGWVEGQLSSLGITGESIRRALMDFLRGLSVTTLLRPWRVWDLAKETLGAPVRRIIAFVKSLFSEILRMIKDAILRPLAALAAKTDGWDLLIAVLGVNPITGEAVPRTPDTLIGGFMKMIGQQEVWENIKRARAIPRAWAWFQGALEGVLSFVRQFPTMFLDALRSLTIEDVVVLPNAFAKVGRAFAGFAGRFFTWAGQQVMSLLQIIFEVVAPGAMPFIRRAAGAFTQIIRNPIGFVGNLVRAGRLGLTQFAGRFLTHLRNSIVGWLTGAMSGAGVYIPRAFELREIIKFVLSVLGLTWQNIRGKLVRLMPEPAVRALETGLDIVTALVREGPAAAWDKIRESISNLREMVMEQVMSFVNSRIVQTAIRMLASALSPAGAFIQAIVAIYNTVMFFVERLRQIGQVVASFVDSISAIASGAVGAAASRVEQTMAGMLTLVISFLARLAGLGNVSDAVKNIINRLRAPIDRALDRVVAWILGLARRLRGSGSSAPGAAPDAADINIERPVTMAGRSHRIFVRSVNGRPAIEMASRRDFLKTMIAAAEAREKAPTGAKRSGLLRRLNNAYTELTGLEQDWWANRDRAGAQRRAEIERRTGQIAANIEAIGREFNIPDLANLGHASKYAEGKQLKPEWQGNVRKKFYPSGYDSAAEAWFDTALLALRVGAPAGTFRDVMTNTFEPVKTATIDHFPTPVYRNWNEEGGNNTTQAGRSGFFNNTGNMRVVCKRNNSSDGAKSRASGARYQPDVGPDFRGPDDNP